MSMSVRSKIARKKSQKWRIIITVYQTLSHPAHLNIITVLKNVSSYLYFAHGATAVCCSDVMHELHGWRRMLSIPVLTQIRYYSVAVGTLALAVRAAMARLTFPVEEFTSQYAVEFIQMRGKKTQKMPVQTVKITLHDNFPSKQESLRLISFNITTISGAATHARTHTDARTLAVWAFVCFWVYIKCVKGNISACLQFANTHVNESTRVNVPMLRR